MMDNLMIVLQVFKDWALSSVPYIVITLVLVVVGSVIYNMTKQDNKAIVKLVYRLLEEE